MKSNVHTTVTEQILRLAKKQGRSINMLADFAGISRGYLSTILRRKKSPTLRTLEKIALALEVEVIDLFRDAD